MSKRNLQDETTTDAFVNAGSELKREELYQEKKLQDALSIRAKAMIDKDIAQALPSGGVEGRNLNKTKVPQQDNFINTMRKAHASYLADINLYNGQFAEI